MGVIATTLNREWDCGERRAQRRLAWTWWGARRGCRGTTTRSCRHQRDRIVELLPPVRMDEDEFYRSRAHLEAPDLAARGVMAAGEFRRARPDISDEAVRALAWCYTFDFK